MTQTTAPRQWRRVRHGWAAGEGHLTEPFRPEQLKTSGTARRDSYQAITDRMVAALERGTVPWQRPWIGGSRPRSMSTRKPYRGINTLILGLSAAERGYTSPWWGTYNQIRELGGQVRKGEHGELITLWKTYDKATRDDDGEARVETIPMLRVFTVFNACQADGLPARFYPQAEGGHFSEITDAEQLLKGYWARDDAPAVFHDQASRAFYRTDGTDEIHLPGRDQFRTGEGYYATAFHESVHSTGWTTRLDREGIRGFDHFGSQQYATEELVAEMGAAMLAAMAGIDAATFDNSAAYVASWLRALKNDKKLVITAAAAAQRAVDLIAPEDAGAEDNDLAEAA